MCDPEGNSPHEWVCAISEQLGMPCDLEPKEITHKVFVKQPIMIIPVPSPDCARDWNYNLHGK
jgi:hypothetical protein